MPLHLIKLCVGAATTDDLRNRAAARLRDAATGGLVHVTRMVPLRRAELLAGGSLYWVIAGQLAARQVVLDVQPFDDEGGVRRCRLVLDDAIVPVLPQPQRPFQGWRYLTDAARPPDLSGVDGATDMPEDLRRALRALCLL